MEVETDSLFDFENSNLTEQQRHIFRRRVLRALATVQRKYRQTRRIHQTLRWVISSVSLIITALSLYAAVEPSRVVSKYVGLCSAVLSACVVSLNEISAQSNIRGKLVLYKQSRTRLSKLIWRFAEEEDHAASFDMLIQRFESLYSMLNQRELDLYRPRTGAIVRSIHRQDANMATVDMPN